jgi:protein tyrosine phosphatase (PTP) superfamily phosphohydrolase (DUF442 family)
MQRKRVIQLSIAGAAVLVALGVAAAWPDRLPKRYAVVEPGRLYRCGTVSPAQLERLQREAGIRRVISLLDPVHPDSVAERQAAERLGLNWENVPLRGNGASTPTDRDGLRGLLLDPNAPPTLVHCAAGVNRTGLAVGMYRLHAQHWTLEQVMAELRANGFEDEPQHENLRQALVEEARLAQAATTSALRP